LCSGRKWPHHAALIKVTGKKLDHEESLFIGHEGLSTWKIASEPITGHVLGLSVKAVF
jgi:hypothetical protein